MVRCVEASSFADVEDRCADTKPGAFGARIKCYTWFPTCLSGARHSPAALSFSRLVIASVGIIGNALASLPVILTSLYLTGRR